MHRKYLRELISIYDENSQQGDIVGMYLNVIKPIYNKPTLNIISQFSSVARSCPTLCDPMDCSTPGLPVHRQLLEFTQTHVHWMITILQLNTILSAEKLF